ncbi:MAG TPA: hypothetical protein VGF79_08595 [Bacteroidia bacterium]
MNKFYLIIGILFCACGNSSSEQKVVNAKQDSTAVALDTAPMTYDQMISAQSQSDTLFTEHSAILMFKKVYPGKTPKKLSDFSGLELKDMKTVYNNLLKVCIDYRDSGKLYTEQIEKMYSALESKLESSDLPDNPLPIGDKLNITNIKSDINTEIAGMKMRQKTK